MFDRMERIHEVDSYTGGEPTRISDGRGPKSASDGMRSRLEELRRDHDFLRSALVNEPRGSEVAVGVLLCEAGERCWSFGGGRLLPLGCNLIPVDYCSNLTRQQAELKRSANGIPFPCFCHR